MDHRRPPLCRVLEEIREKRREGVARPGCVGSLQTVLCETELCRRAASRTCSPAALLHTRTFTCTLSNTRHQQQQGSIKRAGNSSLGARRRCVFTCRATLRKHQSAYHVLLFTCLQDIDEQSI